MKILYVTTVSTTINAFLVPHIEMLLKKGYEVDIATNVIDSVDKTLLNQGCKIIDVSFQRTPITIRNIKAYKKMKEVVNNEYDIIHTHTPVASFITRLVLKFNKNIKSKLVYTAHGFHFYRGAPLLNWLTFYPMEKFLSKYTDTIITINKEDFELVKSRFRSTNANYVPGVGIDLSLIPKHNKHTKENIKKVGNVDNFDLIISYVAELNENKNQILLLETVKELKQKNISVLLLLIGEGINREKYLKYMYDNNLEDNVQLLGFRNDIYDILSISDIYVASSLREGLPVNILEAMAINLPIIATNSRGHRDLINNMENGLLSTFSSIEFSEKIMFLSNNPSIRETFKNNNKIEIKKYELNKVLMELNNIYEKLSK